MVAKHVSLDCIFRLIDELVNLLSSTCQQTTNLRLIPVEVRPANLGSRMPRFSTSSPCPQSLIQKKEREKVVGSGLRQIYS